MSNQQLPNRCAEVLAFFKKPFQFIASSLRFAIELVIELFGADLEPSVRNDKNALNTLQFLATFALTQGGALTLASQYTKSTSLLLCVYLVVAALTFSGVILVLRLTEFDPLASSDSPPRHYFDYPTIVFAKWTLGCTVVLPLIFVALVWIGFAPEIRKPFPGATKIAFDEPISAEKAMATSFAGRTLNEEKQSQELLLRWLSAGAAKDSNLFVVRQTEGFPVDFYNFAVDIQFGSASQPASEGILAFLVADNLGGSGVESVMRPLRFHKDHAGNYLRRFEVTSPRKGERIVLLFVRKELESLKGVTVVSR